MSVVQLRDVCKKYDDKIVLDKFNLSVEEGDFVSITGASGAGKSTLLNIIGLLERADKGDVIIKNEINPRLQDARGRNLLRKELSYLFQSYGLIENETVLKNMEIAARFRVEPKGEKYDKIHKSLVSVGLDGYEKKKVYKLSGGEQQRVALAKIIVKDSGIILADEPTGSLDAGNKRMVLNILKQFNDQGKTIIVVTHDEEVNQCAKSRIKI